MKHIYKEGSKERPVLLLLHGTGGSEESLLDIGRIIDENASILSVRGNISENGMPRFFRRLAEGIFDEEDLIYRTKELNNFLDEASKRYNFNRDNIVAIGYSNGANIAASLLLQYPSSLKAAILHHPMVPIRDIEKTSLKDVPIFIGAGLNDSICRPEETKELEKMFKDREARLTVYWESNGHRLTKTELDSAKKWYKNFLN